MLVTLDGFTRIDTSYSRETITLESGERVRMPVLGTRLRELSMDRAHVVSDDHEVERGPELRGEEQRRQGPGGPGTRGVVLLSDGSLHR